VCGTHPTVTALIDYEQFCGVSPAQQTAAEPVGGSATEISVTELKARMDRGEDVFVLDVREPHEYEINRIPGSTLIPLGDLPQRFTELDANREIICQCKSGSAQRARGRVPARHGFKNGEEPQGRRARLGRPGRSELSRNTETGCHRVTGDSQVQRVVKADFIRRPC
jgi:adenylyltransferase/sulfurtransferase